MNNMARITKVGNSYRVRVAGESAYFSPRDHGEEALKKAQEWRDERWDGTHRSHKLTAAQIRAIRRSKEHYKVLAERYGISANHVHKIRKTKPEQESAAA